MYNLKNNTDEVIQILYEKCDDHMLVGRAVRAIRQEKASSYVEALETDDCPTLDYVATELAHDMASMLEEALFDGSLDPDKLVKDNRETLNLIARHLVVRFIKLKNDSAKEV